MSKTSKLSHNKKPSPSTDEASLMRVMGFIAQELAASEVPKFYSQGNSLNGTLRTVTPDRFLQTTVSRMSAQTARNTSRLEKQRKQQLVKLLGEMKDKPDINPTSKKLVLFPQAPKTAPLYTRVSDLVLQKNEEMRKLQHQALMDQRHREHEECTFQPKSGHQTRRTHEEFEEQALSWFAKRNSALERSQEEKLGLELSELKDRPKLTERSIKLAGRVRNMQKSREGSLTDRLSVTTPRKETVTPEPSFRPILNARTLRLVKKRERTPVHERLYSLSSSRNSSVDKDHKPDLQERDPSLDRKYRINTSKGAASEEKSNEIAYSTNLDFVWKTISSRK